MAALPRCASAWTAVWRHWCDAMAYRIEPHAPAGQLRHKEVGNMLTEANQPSESLAADLDGQARCLLAVQLRALGLDQPGDAGRLAAPAYLQAWLAESLKYVATVGPVDAEAAWSQWQACLPVWRERADLAARARLLDACLKGLPGVLTGEQPATRVLFPGGSMALVEGVYKNNRVSDYFNRVLTEAALAFIESRPDEAEPLRILEIGAGTGGATAGLLAALAPWRDRIGEYGYTDLSQAFLQHGADTFGRDNPFLRTRLFDVSRPCAEQGVATDHYHLVLANNVLHATPEIRQSLRNAKAALRKGGLLMLNEISEASLFTHLSFGLLEGWWGYRDGALRIPGCPGLSPAGWQAVLEQEGFDPVLFPARDAHDLGQQVILAESDGIVRQPAARRPPMTAPAETPAADAAEATPVVECTDGWRQRVTDYLRTLVASTLKIPLEKLSAARPLEDYGLDSILVVRLTNAFNERFEAVDSALFFELPTLAALTEHFLQHRQVELEALLSPAASAEPDPQPHGPSPSRGESAPLERENDVPVPMPCASQERAEGPTPGERRGVAIIGLDGRYPGAASMSAFWENLSTGACAIGEIPFERWDWRRYYDPEKGKAGHLYTRWGGFLPDIDRFDPAFFRISRREAERMDPQERVFLEVAYHCIEDAGYDPSRLHRQGDVGVFVGVMNGSYNPVSTYWSIANRVSYQLDLQGPSFGVDSACSSSLTALHLAVESLLNGGCQLAIAGGVNLITNPQHYLGLCEMMMLSPSGRCSPFGEGADGFVDGEGVGAVLLKPLDRAIADGDRIYGVIRGGALNAGGKTNGYTVPSAGAQQRVLEKALARAGIDADRVSYVETHGTGTALGDPIEISGLSRAFEARDPQALCAIGSVKSNIGHCESAAGIAGLSKVLLQLQHRQLAPSLHAAQANPGIDFSRTPFRVQQRLAPWEARGQTRVATISSFGAGGANASLVVEEYSAAEPPRPAGNGPWLVLLSARDEERLGAAVERLGTFLDSDEASRVELDDLAFTLQVGREAMASRLAIQVTSLADLRRQLDGWRSGESLAGAFQGQVDPFAEATSAETSPEQVAQWLAQRQWDRLAYAWVRGAAIDWSNLYMAERDQRQPRRIGLPGYPFARHRYWMPGLAQPAAPSEQADVAPTARPSDDAEASDCCYLPHWQVQAAVASEAPARPGATLLVTLAPGADSARLQEALASHLGERNALIRVDCAPGATAEVAPGYWRCGHDDAEGFARILASAGALVQVVIIGPAPRDTFDLSTLADSLALHELPVLRLFKALHAHVAPDAGVDCFLLTLGRQPFPGEPRVANPLGAGLVGLAFALAQGDYRMRLRTLDLDPHDLASPDLRAVAAQILAEPASERGEPVKLSRGERFVQRLSPLALPGGTGGGHGLKRQGVYLILGGAGVIGRVVSRCLVERFDARVIWLGRTPADDATLRQHLAATTLRGQVDYLQADATDLAQLQRAVAEVRARHGRIDGALFSGMVFDFENAIPHTSEAQFRQILEVKSRGSINFYRALAEQRLDFLCYFSSGQGFAFSGAAKLSAYACGITFADAFADAIRPMAGFPVGVINWGFWQAALQRQAVSRHMDALSDEAGFDCFGRFVDQLVRGGLPRLLCLKASPEVRQLMGVSDGQRYRLAPPGATPARPSQQAGLSAEERARLRGCFDSHRLDQSIAVLLLVQLQTLGLFREPTPRDAETWRMRAGIAERYRRWWEECLAILVEQGCLTRHGTDYGLAVDIDESRHPAIWSAWEQECAGYREDADRRVQVALVDECLRQLPQILTGHVHATDVLFPEGTPDKVEGVYARNTLSDFFNRRLASRVVEHVRQRLAAEPERPLRLLEVGAGTGGTTEILLEALAPLAGHLEEYGYSDLSQAFLQHGERRFGEGHPGEGRPGGGRPYFTTRILDVSRPLDATDPAIGRYDVVVATNVLHATADLRQTLANVKGMLRGGGLLALNELNRKTTASTVTFGLLDGWWLYEDPQLRIPGSPLLDEERWTHLLWSTGFTQVETDLAHDAGLGQQVITAYSDGVLPILTSLPPAQPVASSREPETRMPDQPDEAAAERLQRLIVECLAETLKAEPESIDLRTPFSDYGVDSILGVGFVKRLGAQLGVRLNSAVLFEHASVARLRDHLLAAHGAQIPAPRSAASAAPAPAPTSPGISAVMAAALGGVPQPARRDASSDRSAGVRIAVIGMAGQFPGAADVHALWDNLLAGRSSVETLPSTYLDPAAYSPDRRPGTSYCNRAGILADRDCFDPLFFTLTPHEAESMTPHQRLVLQESWKALEDAGYNPMTLAGQAVGVYVGAEPGGYQHESFTGGSEAIVASRLSYFLDLRGPAMVVNTGCSSSGVALHQACESLRHGETRLALAGGVHALLDQRGLVSLSAIDMLSPSGQCHTFDAAADGTVISEGVGMVVLKRLEEAEADGDPIYGVIEASGVNQDGASNGITAPNGDAQEQLIRETYRRFAIDAAQISYVEAHGTGTRLGDPVEAHALIRAFRAFTDAQGYCVLGSAKANLGHAAAGAGVIGLIKVLLSLVHRRLPAMPGFQQLNPLIELEGSPFLINREPLEWPPIAGARRLAALNSFGHSGTNAHLVIGDYPGLPAAGRQPASSPAAHVVPLSAKTADALRDTARSLAAWLDRQAMPAETLLGDLAFTLQVAREPWRVRGALVVSSLQDLQTQLAALASGETPAWPDDEAGRLARDWTGGASLDWAALWPDGSGRRLHLPSYPFARERYWIDQASRPAMGTPAATQAVTPSQSPLVANGLFLARPVWQEPLDGVVPEDAVIPHVVFLVGFDTVQADQVEARAAADRCQRLVSDAGTPAARYQALALALLREVQALGERARIDLLVAQRTPGDTLLAGLDGLLKTACLEHPGLSARCLLLEVEHPGPLPVALLASLQASLAETVPAGRSRLQRQLASGEHQELQWQELADDAAPADALAARTGWKEGGVYLITGGAGGLGLLFARAIAEGCREATLLLIGRSALDDGQVARLQALRDLGARVDYAQVDLTDAQALERFIAEVRLRHGGLQGVLHCAGVNRDRSLVRKTPQDLVEVFAAKVIGTELLDRACRNLHLDFFVLFSSCSAVLGSPGQADYAAANAFMDHFAGLRNRQVAQGQRFGHTLSINYPFWRDGGMRIDDARQADVQRQTGMVPLQAEQGIHALQRGLQAGLERLLVIEGDLTRIRGLFRETDGEAAPSAFAMERADGAPVDREALLSATRARLTAVFCAVTKLPAERVEPDAPLEQYGIDSIMITRLNKALDDAFSTLAPLSPEQRQVSKTVFFEYHTLDRLAGYLVDRHAQACLLWCGLAPTPAANYPEAGTAAAQDETLPPVAPGEAEPIAVIGLSGRYPQAATLDDYWRNLRDGRDSITEIPPVRWPLQGFFVDSVQEALRDGRSYSKWGGFVDGFAEFDPLFFAMSPREAVNLDPQERLFLQACWHALEDAGLTRADLAERFQGQVGVFAGITKTGYSLYGPALREQGHLVFPRTSFASTANRVSYLLNLNGPSEPVDTMCSSSLSALHRACDSLRRGECQMAFAGGVNLYLHPSNYVELCAGQMLSRDGRCRSFGEGGNGFVPGEGVGVVVLKPLSRALRDRDNIHAVIRAAAVNHGGRTHGYTVPSPRAQADVIRLALAQAGLSANQVSYIEAHGTGTELGDPIEVSGLSQAFAADGVEPGHCALGSVKASIGHLEAAAGIAGVTKVILQFRHGQLVPSLNADTLNPNLALETTPFRLQRTLADWRPAEGAPRIAGVSSFGAGGANAHVILQEHREYRDLPVGGQVELIPLSARDETRLRAYAEALLAHVEARPDMSGADLANLAYTLQTGREAMSVRLGLAAQSPAALAACLRAFLDDLPGADGVYRSQGLPKDEQVVGDDAEHLLQRWVDGAAVDWAQLHAARPGPQPFRVSAPTYPFARETYWLPGRDPVTPTSSQAEATSASQRPEKTVDSDLLSYLARWEHEAALTEARIDEHRCVLIVAGAPQATAAEHLARTYLDSAAFADRGGRVIRLEPGTRTAVQGLHRWSLDVGDAQALERCLAEQPPVDCLYFIGSTGEADDWSALLDSPAYNELLLLRVVTWLKQHGHPQAIDCYIVSQDAFDVGGTPASAFGGGLTGMAYAIAQGEHRFRVRTLDVSSRELADPQRLPRLMGQVRGECGLPRGEALCLRDGRRYRQRIFRLNWAHAHSGPGIGSPALQPGGLYVILGGSGTVGGIVSRYLMADHRARVVWLGRRPADDDGVRQRRQACLASAGAAVEASQLDYLQADANDPAALTNAVAIIRARHGRIHGAIFSGVVFDAEDTLTRMPEPRFRSILDVKSRGAVAFYRAFADEPLAFMCYFSSAQSFAFSGAARLGAYAAGITFADSLVRSLQGRARFPVGAINWGFWLSSLTEQQAADPSAQPMSRHAGALEDRAGFACFARFADALVQGRLNQAICMDASAPVQQLMHLQPQPVVAGEVSPAMSGDPFARYREAAAPLLADHDPHPFDAAMAGMTLVHLHRMGLFTQPGHFEDPEVLRGQAGIAEPYARWWTTVLDLLQQQGLLQRRGVQVGVEAPVAPDLAARWQRLADALKGVPSRRAQVELVEACLEQLPAILAGRVQATEVMFPRSSMEKVEGVYRDNPLSDYFNQVVAGVVQQQVETLRAQAPGRRIRLLEIGAGTGGTTARVLPALQPWRDHIAEYCYTDLSKAFLMYAEKTFGPGNPFLTYQLLNVERAPAEQGVEPGGYDIVIAANVLHATGRMQRTLANVRSLLRPDGLLVMNEISDRSLFSHLTFGLLKGWWLYEDPELRIPGTPALYPESWNRVLGEVGFRDVRFPAACAHGLGQQIVIARSSAGGASGTRPSAATAPAANPRPATPAPVGQEGGRRALTALALDGLATTLQLEPTRIDAVQPFADYGIDSILGVSFVNRLGEALGVELNTALLFDYPSLETLVDYLAQRYPAETARLEGGARAIHTPSTAVAAGDRHAVIAARVRQELAQALQLDAARIDPQQPFFDYGLDSILGASFVDRLGNALGLELSTALLFEYSSVLALSAYLATLVEDEPTAGLAPEPPGRASQAPASAPFSPRLEDLFLSGELSIDALLDLVGQDAPPSPQALAENPQP